ncbi:V-type ATP synthase subunit I [Alkalibacter saccharofermentans]|uniref:V/A-type H+-transporting ATPase subunit I n=1 Tax=Alkalibacter saccharofermentans DSM 14828 TaxID=1120975 RepID=A0A1M4X9X5_9FIRM|nr:V-type ATPase 116kDa subunit family protein [Alkalibacter saccharofermentans]SHE90273.1 V/A-type H+-transporting ATPase subunit I [Alkalibacter saccharofermentans DSM 14828]
MAIEKLVMMNVVGKNEYIDSFVKEILFMENVQIVDAYNEIDNFRFTINVTEKNIKEILGFSSLESGIKFGSSDEFVKKLGLIREIFGDEFKIDKRYLKGDIDIDQVVKSVYQIYNVLHKKHKILKLYQEDISQIDQSIKAYGFLESAGVAMKDINNMEYFNYVLGTLSKENVQRLKRNYGNITAIVVHVGSDDDDEVYLVISPKDLERETNRLLRSLSFKTIEGLKPEYPKRPEEIIKWLVKKRGDFQEKVDILENEIEKIKERFREESNYAYNVFNLYKRIEEIKKLMAFSEENFYFSGWIPSKMKNHIVEELSQFEDIIIMFNEDVNDPGMSPPTKLKNNWMFKPFEFMIKMYGMPSYKELDPTPFLSLTYLVFFGFMFGDLGQGFVLFLLGLLIRLKGIKLGGIIERLGITSMVFGLVYGSIFGFETLIPALWVKPFHHINTILITAIIIGVAFLLVGYAYGMINSFKAGNYSNFALGKNGITGTVLYISILMIAIASLTGNRIMSMKLLVSIVVAAIVILFLKESISKWVKLKNADNEDHEEASVVERVFEIFEILLSIVSNTLSFIRVGAFALNHVGLFIAFESLAMLIDSGIGSVAIYILGNIFIIGLEGLIVGIQVLRLEYYELFSKYFEGGGIEFDPAKL